MDEPGAVPDSAQPKKGGHGDHWGCIVRSYEQGELMRLLGEVTRSVERPELFQAEGVGVAACSLGDRVRACVLLVDDRLASAYPQGLGGPAWPVTLTEIVPWANGIEGQLAGTCHGAAVSFFDTRFYANRRRYRVGETYTFEMSAFAYTLGRAPETEVYSDLGAKVSFKGAHAFMPAALGNEDADIDDYWFHSPLEGEVSTTDLLGRPLRVYPVTLALPDEFEMRVDLYAADHALDSGVGRVAPGEDLEGFLWLQGQLHEQWV